MFREVSDINQKVSYTRRWIINQNITANFEMKIFSSESTVFENYVSTQLHCAERFRDGRAVLEIPFSKNNPPVHFECTTTSVRFPNVLDNEISVTFAELRSPVVWCRTTSHKLSRYSKCFVMIFRAMDKKKKCPRPRRFHQ